MAHAKRASIALLAALLATFTLQLTDIPTSSANGIPEPDLLDAGGQSTCQIDGDGQIHCWGYGTGGLLGNGSTANVGVSQRAEAGTPVLAGNRTAVQVSVGDYHTCAVFSDNNFLCWGSAANGVLGYGNATGITDPSVLTPLDWGDGRLTTYIATATQHTCAILDNGDLQCWGSGQYGKLGYGNTTTIGDNETASDVGPVNVGNGRTVKKVAVGNSATCAILDNDALKCWGSGATGQLGQGNTNDLGDNETPDTIPAINVGVGRHAIDVSVGSGTTCALLDNNTVRCWGANSSGQLGTGTSANIGDDETPNTAPVIDFGGGHTATQVDAHYLGACALLDNGTVKCWGANALGVLGQGNGNQVDNPANVSPVALGTGRTALAISKGDLHVCVRLDSRAVKCWGNGAVLGYGNSTTIGDNELPSTIGALFVPQADKPTGVSASGGSGQATVSFTPPDDLGSPFTLFTITSNPGNIVASGTSSPVTITGLTNGLGYTFTVKGTNEGGFSQTSDPSNSVTPAGTPAAPAAPTGTVNPGKVTLNWSAPNNGGSSITGYVVTPYIGGVAQTPIDTGSTTTSYEVTGLVNGTTYTFTVAAKNTNGTGTASSQSSGYKPQGPPSAPVNLTAASQSSTSALVTWSAPTTDGGATIAGYTVKYRPVNGQWIDIQGNPTSPVTLTELSPGTSYEVSVVAVNTKGNSPAATATFATTVPPVTGIAAPVFITPQGTVQDVPVYTPPTPAPIVAATPSGLGSWALAPDGGVFTAGDAGFFGSMGGQPLNAPAIGIAPTPSGAGYFVVGSDGGVFTFGDAPFHGSMGGQPLNSPITGIAPGCTSDGYYLVGGDGGVFAFGDVGFHGSMAGQQLNGPMTGLVDSCGKQGYWTFAKDGGVFTFGDALFYGSLGSNPPPGGVIGMVSAPDGNGYWLIGADKHAYGFGSVAN
jgi:hypothetical protein